jgi:hypothetical protein
MLYGGLITREGSNVRRHRATVACACRFHVMRDNQRLHMEIDHDGYRSILVADDLSRGAVHAR